MLVEHQFNIHLGYTPRGNDVALAGGVALMVQVQHLWFSSNAGVTITHDSGLTLGVFAGQEAKQKCSCRSYMVKMCLKVLGMQHMQWVQYQLVT